MKRIIPVALLVLAPAALAAAADTSAQVKRETQTAVAALNPRPKHAHVASDRVAAPKTNGADK